MATVSASPFPDDFPITRIGLRTITVDPGLQMRVQTDQEHAKGITDTLLRLRQHISDPVIIFDDGKTNWLADGHHRFIGYSKAAEVDPMFKHIWAQVRPGTREDAMVHAAGANKETETKLKRSPEDKERAIKTLLAIPDWENKTSAAIARHVGVSRNIVRKARVAFESDKGKITPSHLVGSDGRSWSVDHRKGAGREPRMNRHGVFTFYFQGKTYRLGRDAEVARRRVQEMLDGLDTQKRSLLPNTLRVFFTSKGFNFEAGGFLPKTDIGLSGFVGHGSVWISRSFGEPALGKGGDNYNEAVGCILQVRNELDPSARAVIVCYPQDALPKMLGRGRALGIEYLSPEDFVVSLQASEPKQDHGSSEAPCP